MIVGSFGRYTVETAHDHELGWAHEPVRNEPRVVGPLLLVLLCSRHAPVSADIWLPAICMVGGPRDAPASNPQGSC